MYNVRTFVYILFLVLSSDLKASTEKATLVFAAEMPEIATDRKGGYPELATLLKQQRKKAAPTFFLFGGGSFGPSSLSSLDRGTHIIDLLNSLEPDAMGVAKREFSFLEDELSLRSYEAAFPLVASNLVNRLTQENLDGLVKSVIVQQGSYKFGILSILDNSVVEEYALAQIKITNQIQAIKSLSLKLRNQVDLIILLYSHSNPEVTQLLNNNIIDISLRRDEHYESTKDQHPHDILLSKSGKAAIIHLNWQTKQPQSLQLKWEQKKLRTYSKDPEVLRQVISYTNRLTALLQQKIGILATAMDTNILAVRTAENPFANYITSALIAYTNADIALINGGTIRGEKIYTANTVLTRSDIIKELPFRNRVALLQVTGKQIIDALENGFSLINKVKGRYPQISGMRVVYNSARNVGDRVVSVKIDGQSLDMAKLYKLVTTDYLAVGGDGYSMFKNLPLLNYNGQMSRLLSDIIIDSIKAKKSISVSRNYRLIDLNNNKNISSND